MIFENFVFADGILQIWSQKLSHLQFNRYNFSIRSSFESIKNNAIAKYEKKKKSTRTSLNIVRSWSFEAPAIENIWIIVEQWTSKIDANKYRIVRRACNVDVTRETPSKQRVRWDGAFHIYSYYHIQIFTGRNETKRDEVKKY